MFRFSRPSRTARSLYSLISETRSLAKRRASSRRSSPSAGASGPARRRAPSEGRTPGRAAASAEDGDTPGTGAAALPGPEDAAASTSARDMRKPERGVESSKLRDSVGAAGTGGGSGAGGGGAARGGSGLGGG